MSEIEIVLKHFGANYIPSGRGWRKMKCPFHNDSHASAGVNHELEAFNCLGCDITGDIYNIIQKIEGVEFVEAKSRAKEIIGEGIKPLRTEHSFGRNVSQKQGAISSRRKETSTWGSAPTSRRSRNV